MSIFIKGFDMPKGEDGLLSINIFPDGRVKYQFDDGSMSLGKAIEVSTPHGKLIDADEMSRMYTHYGIPHMWDAVDLDEMLEEMPAVIESEE